MFSGLAVKRNGPGSASAVSSQSLSPVPGSPLPGFEDDEKDPDAVRKFESPIAMTDTYKPQKLGAVDDAARYKADMERLPDGLTTEEMNVDVESFAKMMLMGMKRSDGTVWKEGEGLQIGSMVEAQVAVPKQRGAGLGSEASSFYEPLKPGETNRGHMVASGGKHRNYVGVSEKLVKRKVIEAGSLVVLTHGAHEGKAGNVAVFPETGTAPRKDDKITVTLSCSGSQVVVPFGAVRLYTSRDDERKVLEKSRSSQKQADDPPPSKRRRKARPLDWVIRPNMIVRCIDDALAKGRYYNEKLRVSDITSLHDFSLQTKDGILDGIHEDQVETVIPRETGSRLLILKGSKKGSLATLIQRDKAKQEVVVRFDGSLTKQFRFPYYDVCSI